MLKQCYQYGLALVVTLGILPAVPAAESNHNHSGKHKQYTGDSCGHDSHQGHMHRHPKWEPAPADYTSMKSNRWTDANAITRGEKLFQTNCEICHGSDGKGAGPAAKGLIHPPADLNHHFHIKPGDGDAYLFWRVSEGGMVEPFKSMKSSMPAFKALLSEDQRWDVLAYVHSQFHKTFKSETITPSVIGEGNIIAVVHGSEQVVVNHQAIKGFMKAMTMGYKVQPASLLDNVQAGDQVRFTIDTQQNVIIKIEKMTP